MGRLATYANNHTIFHHTDWLGSERRNTDETGTIQETCTGLPFGDGESCTGPGYSLALFTGDEHDSESNTEHTLFRQMSGTQGRWLSPDPYNGSMDISNPQSMNRYAYVNNDPVDFTDFFGLDNDCQGKPCTPFSYVSGNCIVQVTYQKVKANNNTYDMPTITTVCGIGGGGNRGGTVLAGWRCPRCFFTVMTFGIRTKNQAFHFATGAACYNAWSGTTVGKATEFFSLAQVVPGFNPQGGAFDAFFEDVVLLGTKFGGLKWLAKGGPNALEALSIREGESVVLPGAAKAGAQFGVDVLESTSAQIIGLIPTVVDIGARLGCGVFH